MMVDNPQDPIERNLAEIGGGLKPGDKFESTRSAVSTSTPLIPVEITVDVSMPKDIAVTVKGDNIEGDFKLTDAQKKEMMGLADVIVAASKASKVPLAKEYDLNGDGIKTTEEIAAVTLAYAARNHSDLAHGKVQFDDNYLMGHNVGGATGIVPLQEGTLKKEWEISPNALNTAQVKAVAQQIMDDNHLGNLSSPVMPVKRTNTSEQTR